MMWKRILPRIGGSVFLGGTIRCILFRGMQRIPMFWTCSYGDYHGNRGLPVWVGDNGQQSPPHTIKPPSPPNIEYALNTKIMYHIYVRISYSGGVGGLV